MVLPEAPYRQWTMTFPFALRFLMAKDHRLITAILGIALRLIFAWQRLQARRADHRAPKCAAVLFVQRFGGALNCNVHGHALVPDGVFVLNEERTAFTFALLPPPEDNDILCLTERLARRVMALCERRFGAFDPPEEGVLESAIGEGLQNLPRLARDIEEEDVPGSDPRTLRTSRRAAWVEGFSIHANTAVPAPNRLGLEKLCRYGLRPAFAQERLSFSASGQVQLGLRRPWPKAGGVSVLSFEPVDFLRRLAPLIPPPYANLVRHYGLFAPNAKARDLLPPAPASPLGLRRTAALRAECAGCLAQGPSRPIAPSPGLTDASAVEPSAATEAPGDPAAPRPARPPRTVLPWAELLRRVFAVDVLVCPRCLGAMSVIAYLSDPVVVGKILGHLGLPQSPLPIAPARRPAQAELFEEVEEVADDPATDDTSYECLRTRGGRGPPVGPGPRFERHRHR